MERHDPDDQVAMYILEASSLTPAGAFERYV
jgi:hypothetical protein